MTIAGNVPFNRRTARIVGRSTPAGFRAMRRSRGRLQLIRGSLQLPGFVLLTLGILL